MDSSASIWSIGTGEMKCKLEGHTAEIVSVDIDQKKEKALTGSFDNLIMIWDPHSGERLTTLA